MLINFFLKTLGPHAELPASPQPALHCISLPASLPLLLSPQLSSSALADFHALQLPLPFAFPKASLESHFFLTGDSAKVDGTKTFTLLCFISISRYTCSWPACLPLFLSFIPVKLFPFREAFGRVQASRHPPGASENKQENTHWYFYILYYQHFP